MLNKLWAYKQAGVLNEVDGLYRIPHPWISSYFIIVMASSGIEEIPWEHVSVSLQKLEGKKMKYVERCPTWEEMCWVKSQFWDEHEAVMQLHPPKSDWVNNHPYCLHLWKPLNQAIPLPPSITVGMKDMNTDTNQTF